VIIEGYGEKPQYVEETIQCQSIIGKTSGKDRIMKFKVKCEFIAPLVSFSTRDLVFRCEHDGVGFPSSHTKKLTISNVSSLDLTAQLTTNSHFSLVNDHSGRLVSELLVNLKTGESLHVGVVFDTTFKKDFHNEVVNGVLNICYAEHEHNVSILNKINAISFNEIF
jgi:hydrocephalus-inducing protein